DLTLKKLFILIAVNIAAGVFSEKPLDVFDLVRRKTPTQQDAADLRTARPGPGCFLLYISVGLVAGLLGSALKAFPRGPKVLNSLLPAAGLEREDRLYRGTHYLALLLGRCLVNGVDIRGRDDRLACDIADVIPILPDGLPDRILDEKGCKQG